MAQEHGKNSYFSVEDSAGTTLRNLTTYVTDVESNWDQEVADTTCKGQTARTFVQGHTAMKLKISGHWDNTVTSGPDVVLASLIGDTGTCTFEWGPEGNTALDIRYTGECIALNYNISSPLADVVKFDAEFQVTGTVTKNAFP
jgi:hypothetical protein